jgi:hypothetical protein
VATIEGIVKIKTGNSISLSEQQVLDCDEQWRNQDFFSEGAAKTVVIYQLNKKIILSIKI